MYRGLIHALGTVLNDLESRGYVERLWPLGVARAKRPVVEWKVRATETGLSKWGQL